MDEFKEILAFTKPEFIANMQVSRQQDQGLLRVALSVDTITGQISVELSGFDGLAESISNLIVAERVVISQELGTGREFGTVRIECWVDECYSEFWCDSARQT